MVAVVREGRAVDSERLRELCPGGIRGPKATGWGLGGGPLWFVPDKAALWRRGDDQRGRVPLSRLAVDPRPAKHEEV